MQGPLPEYGPAQHWHWHVGAGPGEAQDLSTGTASGIPAQGANGSGSLSGGKSANGPGPAGLGLRPDRQPRSRARQPLAIGAPEPSPAGRMSSGTAAAGEPPGPCPHHSPAEGGGGCLTTATAQPWQVQDGRRRPAQLSAKCRAAWQQPQPALPWLPTSLYSLIRSLPQGRDLPGIGRLAWPAFGCPQVRPRSMEICR
jgi:hypothetical protein